VIFVFLLHSLAASTMTVQKIAVGYFSPLFIITVRSLLGGAILLIIHRLWDKTNPLRLLRKYPWEILIVTMLVTIIPTLIKIWMLTIMPSVKVGFFRFTDPFVTVALVYLLYGVKTTRRQWLGILVATAGILFVLLEKSGSEGVMAFGRISWAEILLIGAYSTNRYGWLRIQKFLKKTGCGVKELNGLMMSVGGLLTLLATTIFVAFPSVPILQQGGVYLLYVVLMTNVIGYTLYSYLLTKYSATLLSLTSFARPLLIALFGAVFLHETVSWVFAVSCAFVMGGLAIFYSDELRTLKVRS
jgi:drug/metabolite transporter (DMT)-like permease